MNSPAELPVGDKSVSTSPACHRGWHRALWGGSLLAMVTLLAMHVALAHSPELASFIPERLIQPQSGCASHRTGPALSSCPGSCARGAMPAASGCGARGHYEQPILTDSLYEEQYPADPSADAPADAADCLPQDNSDDSPTGLQA